MALVALSGFYMVINKEQPLILGWKSSEFQGSLIAAGSAEAAGGPMSTRVPVSALVSSGKGALTSKKKGRSAIVKEVSKGEKLEPVLASRDQVAGCAVSSAATLERVFASGGAVLDDNVPEVALPGRDLSPAGDAASFSERSRLESQWAKHIGDRSDGDPEQFELCCLRESEGKNSAVASKSQSGTKKLVSSGRPKARARRLDARRNRLSTTPERAPLEAFTIFPRKGVDGRSDHRKVEGVQGYVSTYMREITKIDRLTADEELMLSRIIRIGFLMKDDRKKLERQVGHQLTKQQWADSLQMTVAELESKLHEADLARDRMVMANLRLVVSVVKRYNCEGLEVADLIQEGSIGLLRGVERFDHTRGYKLSTYVHWWIRQGVSRAIADHSRTVRLPVHIHDALSRIRRAKVRMLQDGDTATVQTLGDALNLSMPQIMTVLRVQAKRLKSFDMQVGHQRNFLTGGDSETFHSLVADSHDENQPWTMVERAQLKGDVEKALNSHLGSREREIIKMHFGVDTADGCSMSLENISHRFGLSRERVRQLDRAAKQKLLTTGLDKYQCGGAVVLQ